MPRASRAGAQYGRLGWWDGRVSKSVVGWGMGIAELQMKKREAFLPPNLFGWPRQPSLPQAHPMLT